MIRNGLALLLALSLSVPAWAGELDGERPGKLATATVAAGGDALGSTSVGREMDREMPTQACWGGYSSSYYWGGYPSSSFYWGGYPSYNSSYYWGGSPSYSSYYWGGYPSYSSYYWGGSPGWGGYRSSYYYGW